MKGANTKATARSRRKKHIRKVVQGTKERPRLVVYRSLKNVYAQLADDMEMVTLTGVSTLSPSLKKELSKAKGNVERSNLLGEAIARVAKEKGITEVVFDRNGFPYHGQVKAFAEGARKGGLKF